MAQTARALRSNLDRGRQLPLQPAWARTVRPPSRLRRYGEAGWARGRHRGGTQAPLCAGCRAREARYGFRDEREPLLERPRTLCFECFRIEVGRRQAVAARMARGWNARQTPLPLEQTLRALAHRRTQAQMAARRALGVAHL